MNGWHYKISNLVQCGMHIFSICFFGRWPWWKWSCVSWSGGWTSSFGNCRNLFFYTLLPAVSSTKLCNWYIFIQTWFNSFYFTFILLNNFNQMKIKPIENFFWKPISMISSASFSNLKKKQQQRAWTIFCCSVRRIRGIGKPEMPPLPSSDKGVEVVVIPSDRTSGECNHWCPDKSTNPWVGDLSLNHVTKEGTCIINICEYKFPSTKCTFPIFYESCFIFEL